MVYGLDLWWSAGWIQYPWAGNLTHQIHWCFFNSELSSLKVFKLVDIADYQHLTRQWVAHLYSSNFKKPLDLLFGLKSFIRKISYKTDVGAFIVFVTHDIYATNAQESLSIKMDWLFKSDETVLSIKAHDLRCFDNKVLKDSTSELHLEPIWDVRINLTGQKIEITGHPWPWLTVILRGFYWGWMLPFKKG